MLVISKTLPPQSRFDAELELPFDLRQKSRLRTRTGDGEEVGLFLQRGHVLRGGDYLQAEDGRIVRVKAKDEQVLHVECPSFSELVRVSYHLGNRHVPLQVGERWVRIANDYVLRAMVEGLGASVKVLDAPFEPEAGAYGGGHHHGDAEDARHSGIIHQFGRTAGQKER